jgi:hypothetical protein
MTNKVAWTRIYSNFRAAYANAIAPPPEQFAKPMKV